MKKRWSYLVLFLIECLGCMYFIPIWNFRDGQMRCLADGEAVGVLFIVLFGIGAILSIAAYLVHRFNFETKICKGVLITINIICGITFILFFFITILLIMEALSIPWFPAQE